MIFFKYFSSFFTGHGTIITSHDKLSHYLSLLTNQFPIESNFVALVSDNLNAEISLGTVTNIAEAVQWVSYSYLYVRMRKNPLVYGMKYQDIKDDPLLETKRTEIIREAARRLGLYCHVLHTSEFLLEFKSKIFKSAF